MVLNKAWSKVLKTDSVVAAFAILYLLGRREDRAIRRDGEQLMSQRRKSPKDPGGPSHKA